MSLPQHPSLDEAITILAERGIRITSVPGEYVVNYKGGATATEYRFDDLDDAVAHGLSLEPAAELLPPLGPLGGRYRWRAAMYRHNQKLAAKRRGR